MKTQNVGSVYLIRVHNYVKIGFSTDIYQRMSHIQMDNPYDINLIREIENCSDRDEKWMHRRYSEYRERHEWFIFCEDMLTVNIDHNDNSIISNPNPTNAKKIIRVPGLKDRNHDLVSRIDEITKILFKNALK